MITTVNFEGVYSAEVYAAEGSAYDIKCRVHATQLPMHLSLMSQSLRTLLLLFMLSMHLPPMSLPFLTIIISALQYT